MEKELYSKKGTIANVFVKHRDEIYALCETPSQFKQLQAKVNELLDSKELENNSATQKAKDVFDRCSRNYSLYLSTLMTYMTGVKVS